MTSLEEERNEPRVEIDGEMEVPSPPTPNSKTESSLKGKKIGLVLLLAIGVGGLIFGFWSASKGRIPIKDGEGLHSEISTLKKELARLDQEMNLLKNDLNILKEKAKVVNEPVRGLKEQEMGSSSTPPRPSSPLTVRTPSKPLIYRVRRGDTVDSVAKRFKTTSKELKRWNHLKANEPLIPGRNLIVRPANP